MNFRLASATEVLGRTPVTLEALLRGLDLQGKHPIFGPVTLRQLLSTWVAHDLGHVAQVARVMAKHRQ